MANGVVFQYRFILLYTALLKRIKVDTCIPALQESMGRINDKCIRQTYNTTDTDMLYCLARGRSVLTPIRDA